MFETQCNINIDQAIINEDTLSALCEAIGEEAMNEFLYRFFEDCKARTERIIDAYGNNQFSEVELEAHTLGSSAATYGALKLEGICREIESAQPIKDQTFRDRIDRLMLLSEQSLRGLREYAMQTKA